MKQSHLLRGLWFIGEFSEIDYNKLVQGHATNAPRLARWPQYTSQPCFAGANAGSDFPSTSVDGVLSNRGQSWSSPGYTWRSSLLFLTGHASCSL